MSLKQIEQYKIESIIGKGGLGTVYLAQDLNLSRYVAIKVIYPQFTNQRPYHEHIMRQARASARLTHPSIATIFNFDHKDNQLYLIIEHINGENLASLLGQLRRKQQIVRLDEALLLTAQVADALAYAHQQGILHTNFKPSNILIKPVERSSQSKEPLFRAVITDFGMTRLLKGDVKSAPIALADALPYMSPEQSVGNPIDAQSDIYSLGIILYQLATGRLPFHITSPTEAMVMHSLEAPPTPRSIQPGIPKAVDALINKMLAKKGADRFQDAMQLADSARQAAETIGKQQLLAYPPGTITSLSALLSPAVSERSEFGNGTMGRAIDGWLPVPEDELVAILQAELQGQPLPNSVDDSIHDDPPEDALPVVDDEERPFPPPVISPDHHTPVLPYPRRTAPKTPQPIQPHVPMDNQLLVDQVVITRPGRAPRTLKLDKDRLRIGRARENDIVLGTPDVSRHHALLEKTSTGWQIVDLNSSGGTYWGGHRLVSNVPEAWNQNQVLRIGPYTLRWQPARTPLPFRADEQEEEEVTKLHQIPAGGVHTSSRTGQFSVMANPTVLTLAPGEETIVQVEIFNQGVDSDTFSLRIVDLHPAMAMLSQNSVFLAPGTRAHLPITLTVPAQSAIQAGHHPFQIVVRTEADRAETAVISARVTVTTSEKFTLGVWPQEIKNGGECQVLIRNEGNVANRFSLTGQSDEPTLQFGGERGHVRLEPGQAATLSLAVSSSKQPILGRSRQHPFSVRVRTSSGVEQHQSCQLKQQPIIPSWVLPALEILAVVLFAAYAASRFFGNEPGQADTSTPVMALESTVSDSSLGADLVPSATAVATDVPLVSGGPEADDDVDGLANADETIYGTDPQNPDTDGDGLRDGDEVTTYQTNPLYADTDLDGVRDGDEIAAGTDPLRFPLQTATSPAGENDLPAVPAQPSSTTAPADTAVPIPTNPPPAQQPGSTAVPTQPPPTAAPPTALPEQPTAVPTQVPPTAPPANNITIQAAIINDGTGWVTESGQVNLGLNTPVQAGDLSNNEAVRGFITFDLSPLPTNAVLESARLTFSTADPDTGVEGNPFSDLDCMVLEAAEYELPLDASDYDAFAFYIDCEPGRPGTVDVLIDVQDALDFDLTHLQIRFGFDINTDNDGANDLYLVRTAPILEIIYREP